MIIYSEDRYDLDERTFLFAKNVRDCADKLSGKITDLEIGKHLIRSAGSVGANYIEANEALSRKDFLMRIKVCRKEAKEARYWLALSEPLEENQDGKTELMGEATELMKIFASIIRRTTV